MKAIVLADLHTFDEKTIVDQVHFDECQFIISVGDLTDTKRRINETLGTRRDFKFSLPVIGVLGNHENWEVIRKGRYGLRNVHKKVLKYKGLNFSGIGGVIAQRPRRIYHNDLEDICKWLKRLIKKGTEIDVFVVHESPYNCFDLVRGKHRGVKEYKELLVELAPRWIFTGHMHTYRGLINWPCGTNVVNPGVGFKGEYAIFDISKNKIRFF